MFVGTPCQVAGLKSYLEATNTDMKNVYLYDLICHGVPRPGVWKHYIRRTFQSKHLERITFKDKRIGWKQPLAFAVADGKEKSLRPYTLLYFGELISRPSCECCTYASLERISDITIGDHWSVQAVDANFYDKDGVSSVFVNTEKGQELFSWASNSIEYRNEHRNKVCSQICRAQHRASTRRSSFWLMYHRNASMAVLWFDFLVATEKILRRMMK